MQKILFLLLLISTSLPVVGAEPDWAYPRKVAAASASRLKSYLKAGREPQALEALVDLTTARCLQDPDQITQALQTIAATARQGRTPAFTAMTHLLHAEALTILYRNDMSRYLERHSAVPGDDPRQWCAAQLCDSVEALVNEALRERPPLEAVPIDDYAACLVLPRDCQAYFPTLYSFVELRAWRILQAFDALPGMGRRADDMALHIAHALPAGSAPAVFWALNTMPSDATIEQYRALLDTHAATPYSCDILMRWPLYGSLEQRRDLWRIITRALRLYPDYYNAEGLRGRLDQLMQPKVNVAFPVVVAPSCTFPVTVTASNATNALIEVYSLPDEGTYKNSLPVEDVIKQGQKVQTLEPHLARFLAEGPWESVDTINTSLFEPGRYALVATLTGAGHNSYSQVMQCTDVVAVTASSADTMRVVAINPHTGAPVAGATVKVTGRRYDNGRHTPASVRVGDTGADGSLLMTAMPDGLYDMQLNVSHGKSIYAMPYWALGRGDNSSVQASGYTSLRLYRPGDNMQWTFVVSHRGPEASDMGLATALPCTVRLLDANNQETASTDVTTDDYGRVTGTFGLPATGLTGTFTLQISTDGHGTIGSATFMVADYKMPSIKVDDVAVAHYTSSDTCTVVTAKAMTYTGMAVAGAPVSVEVTTRSPWRWWWRPFRPQPVWHGTALTDASGAVSLDLPQDVLAKAGTSFFTVRVSVTATNGETQWAEAPFGLGAPLAIALDDATVDTSRPYEMAVNVVNARGESVDTLAMTYRLMRGYETVRQGSLTSPRTTLDLSALPAGIYTLRAVAKDSTLATPTQCRLTLYNPAVAALPVDKPLWVPSPKVSTSAKSTRVTYGVGDDDTYIFWWLRSGGHISRHGVIKSARGYHNLPVSLPKGQRQGTLTLLSVKDLAQAGYDIAIECDTASQMRIEVETMRDMLTPGQPETWRLRVRPAAGGAAMMLDMYNQALEALTSFQQEALPWKGWLAGLGSPMRLGSRWAATADFSLSARLRQRTYGYIQDPSWQFYGKDLGLARRGLRNVLLMKQAGVAMTDNMVMEGMAMARNEAATAQPDIVEDTSPKGEESPYREIETPLALYRPMLVTEADGSVSLNFTVPNANATWALQALAWDKNLSSASLQRTFTAVRPLMVKANPPRFLRAGDHAAVATSVMNNSADTMHVVLVSEAYDPLTDATLRADTATFVVAPRATLAASLVLDAPWDIPMVGLRVKASDGTYTDGEATLLPVLPSSLPVIEAQPFYMAPTQPSATLTLSRPNGEGARMTLQMTTAPQWSVMTAMPSLRTADPSTSPQAAANLYIAALGTGIISQNPSVADAITQWSRADAKDSTLISQLSRNAQLKTSILEATPWMQEATNDTQRMSRLALLLDPEAVQGSITQALEALSTLSRDGAWGWCAGDHQASMWATMQVLDILGELPPGLPSQTIKRIHALALPALKWLDEETLTLARRYPKTHHTQWAVLRSRWQQAPLSNQGKELMAKEVAYVLKHWKDADVATQARWAIFLEQQNYHATALNIIHSLGEYTVTSPEKGAWLPRLDGQYSHIAATAAVLKATRLIEPSSPLAEGYAQWLVLQKEATLWRDNAGTAAVISALVYDGNLRLTPASEVEVSRGGQPLEVASAMERVTGHFTVPVEVPTAGSVPLTVSRKGREASYGCLYTMYRAEAGDVAAASIPDLSIEKVYENAADNAPADVNALSVGQRIRVSLRIRAARDMDYVSIIDDRAATLEPCRQLPEYVYSQGLGFYLEPRDAQERIFISHLPKGYYMLTYDMTVNNVGRYTGGIATIQSQYAPELTAHSAGSTLNVLP